MAEKKVRKANANRTISVDALARVEGEGGMQVIVKDGRVTDVKLNIFEPPRFFEALLEGRDFTEAPDITSRICGICPIAYQMSACHAMEMAMGVTVDGPLRELRRLIFCGEWIESHALHVFMLHAPDFLGYESAIHMSADHPQLFHAALKIKAIGNEIMEVVGGRAVHPINVRVGGFYRIPDRRALAMLVPKVEWARAACLDAIPVLAGFEYPHFEQDYELVALRHQSEYPICEGRLVSNRGLDIATDAYNEHFEEIHIRHSNALHGVRKKRGRYFVGPMARYSLNADKLSPVAKEAAVAAGLGGSCNNPFKSILVRTVELVYACDEALRIIRDVESPDAASIDVVPRAGIGHGCTEAPRGILYHRYEIDEAGKILHAQIVPPTSQNQPSIEADLGAFVQQNLSLGKDELQWRCEQAIRNYDPCISCATHFLKLEIVEK